MKRLGKVRAPWWLFGLVVVVGLVYAVYSWVIVPRRAAHSTIQTLAVERVTIPLTVSANGVIQPERAVNISPKTPGLLKKLLVKQGDQVQAGQILAQMDDSSFQGQLTQARGQLAAARANLQRLSAGNRPQDIAQAQARLQDARYALQLAQENLRQDQQLFDSGAISARAVDTTRITRDRAQSQVTQAAQALALAQVGSRAEDIAQARAQVLSAQGQLQSAQVQVNDTLIRAPFTGIVTRKFADPGAFVAPTTAGSAVSSATSSSILALAGTNQVVANVAEANIAQLQLGQKAIIQADAYRGVEFTGRIVEIAPQAIVVQNVTSFEVKATILTKPSALRAGMNVDVDFYVGALKNALMVPTVAIVRQENQTGVYVAGADQKPTFTPITPGATVDTRTQVLSGLKGSEQVFISFPEGFRPETKIPGLR
ncbi:efflux RND transporter periplasmic adaptor subunit [Anthocerotibacter panamensis]|uniref:efflux RND transporter periplasmic adaptor subunit n=1 Tax=Anthocerotibacter panamensis TaxID=2857077 RepID=UPI001C40343E|nr:efflux RND transporter periplasmic adaptor subunit [Anthocerotibacter panamensis]